MELNLLTVGTLCSDMSELRQFLRSPKAVATYESLTENEREMLFEILCVKFYDLVMDENLDDLFEMGRNKIALYFGYETWERLMADNLED